MTKHAPRLSYLRNPLTLECKAVPSPEGRRLRGYGWSYITKLEMRTYQVQRWSDRYSRYYTNYTLTPMTR